MFSLRSRSIIPWHFNGFHMKSSGLIRSAKVTALSDRRYMNSFWWVALDTGGIFWQSVRPSVHQSVRISIHPSIHSPSECFSIHPSAPIMRRAERLISKNFRRASGLGRFCWKEATKGFREQGSVTEIWTDVWKSPESSSVQQQGKGITDLIGPGPPFDNWIAFSRSHLVWKDQQRSPHLLIHEFLKSGYIL